MSFLGELLDKYRVISLIGMSKNAGKTTVLNHLIQYFKKNNLSVALTSIGRDGEDTDVVTGTKKPRIYVSAGSIIVTAEALLKLSDVTFEILSLTEYNTPLGRIIITRALSDGFVQIGGASISFQIFEILKNIAPYNVDKVLIDGAINRKSISNPLLAEAVVLSAGASLSSDMDEVILKTKHAAKILMLQKTVIHEPVYDTSHHEYIPGAITDTKIRTLLFSGKNLKGYQIVCDDPSKVLISVDIYEKLLKSGAVLTVKNPVNLVAITVNPVSVNGFCFPKNLFLQKMTKAVDIPVVDVKS